MELKSIVFDDESFFDLFHNLFVFDDDFVGVYDHVAVQSSELSLFLLVKPHPEPNADHYQ